MDTRKKGYIIPLTLLIIAVAVALITAVVRESFRYHQTVRIARSRVEARLLALSSLEVVLSQLSYVVAEKNEAEKKEPDEKQSDGKQKQSEEKKEEVLEPLQDWMIKVLPLLNRWNTLEIAGDNIKGTISYYIAAEQGKINLDELLKDIKQKGKKSEEEKNMDARQAGKQPPVVKPGEVQKKSLALLIDEQLKKEKEVGIKDALTSLGSLEDATDFLKVPRLAKLKESIFVNQEMPKKPVFLMDLFTTADNTSKINPWLLTRSVKTVMGLKEMQEFRIDKKLIKKLKPKMNWAQEWDPIFEKAYGIKFSALEKSIVALFATEFEATAFFVVSYCKVGTMVQKIGALMELTEPGEDLSPKSFIFKVTKLYWL